MKLAIIMLLVLALAAGTVVGLGSFGILSIPGISPPKFGKPIDQSKNQRGGLVWNLAAPFDDLTKQAADIQRAQQKAAPKTPVAPQPTFHPELGDAQLAELWNDLDVPQLVAMTEKWQPAALAKILSKMDSDQVVKYLDALKAERADQICRAIQTLASQTQSSGKA